VSAAGNGATLARFIGLVDDGTAHRELRAARSRSDWARRIGISESSLRSTIARARAAGIEVPDWGDPGSGEDVTQPATPRAIAASRDFDVEEPTVRDVEAQSVRVLPCPEPVHTQSKRMSGVRDPFTRHLTRDDVPNGSVIAVLSDIHVPYHDEPALRLAIECCEDAGASIVILNGDIADCGPSSRHEQKRRREIQMWGSTHASVEPGRWIYDWARTKRCFLIRGNHEGWCENEIKESPTMYGSTPEHLMGLPEDGDGWEVLPDMSSIRLGNRVWEHGNAFFKSGSPGQNPGARLKSKAPDQSTSIGHCHIKHASFWTTEDEFGIGRTRAAYFNGHLSKPEAHAEYAGTRIQWQQSFELTRVYWVDDRPRFTTDQPEIHRDKRGRPVFEYGGVVYR